MNKKYVYKFPDIPRMRRIQGPFRRQYTGQQPGTKSGRGPAHNRVVNRMFCSFSGLHGISFVRASGGSFRAVVFDALEGKRVGRFLGEPARRRTVLPLPTAPRPRRAPLRPDPPVGCPGFAFGKNQANPDRQDKVGKRTQRLSELLGFSEGGFSEPCVSPFTGLFA